MVRDFSQKTVQELYETIRVNVDEEEQWKVFAIVKMMRLFMVQEV